MGFALRLSLFLVCLPASAADVPKAPKPPLPPIERRPYAIRAWVSTATLARLDEKAKGILIEEWKRLAGRFVGAPWALEIAKGDGPFAGGDLEGVEAEAVRKKAEGVDKAWLIRVEPLGNGFDLTAREYDATTRLLGPVCRRVAASPIDATRALLNLSLDVFEPLAEVGASSGGGVTIKVQGAAISPPGAPGRIAAPGSVFRPLRIASDSKGGIKAIVPIRATYLRVGSVEGGDARCQIETRLNDPLSKLVVGRVRVVALGVKPSAIRTRLRFVIGKEKEPAAGYTLTARRLPDGLLRVVGTTDREGRAALEPGFASGLVSLRLVAGGIEPLTEFPIMPGEQAEERTIVLNDAKADAVALETTLSALRDEIIDQVAIRGRLEARLKSRADALAWDDVKTLLDQSRALATRDAFQARLDVLKADAQARQKQTRVAVLTATATAQLGEVQALADRYLDDDVFRAYDDALKQAAADGSAPKVKGKVVAKAAPKPKAEPSADADLPTAARAQGAPGNPEAPADPAALGMVEVPVGGGFRVAMPAEPTTKKSSSSKIGGQAARLSIYELDQGEKVFRLVRGESDSTKGRADARLDAIRDDLISKAPTDRLLNESKLTLAGKYPVRDLRFRLSPVGGGDRARRVRIYVVDKSYYELTFEGPEADADSPVVVAFLGSLTVPPPPAGARPAAAPSGKPAGGSPF